MIDKLPYIIVTIIFLVFIFFRLRKKKNINTVEFINESRQNRIKELDVQIQLNPNDYQAIYARGMAKLKVKDKLGALKDFQRAGFLGYETAFETISQFKLDVIEKDEELFFDKKEKPNQVSTLNIPAEYLGEMEDYNKAIQINPNNSVAYFLRAGIKELVDDHNGAIEDLNAAIKIKINYAEAYFKRGLIKLKINEKAKAAEDFTKAIQLGYPRAEAYLEKCK
jgi:tetratricopeptide (TPR) repeat protein